MIFIHMNSREYTTGPVMILYTPVLTGLNLYLYLLIASHLCQSRPKFSWTVVTLRRFQIAGKFTTLYNPSRIALRQISIT